MAGSTDPIDRLASLQRLVLHAPDLRRLPELEKLTSLHTLSLHMGYFQESNWLPKLEKLRKYFADRIRTR